MKKITIIILFVLAAALIPLIRPAVVNAGVCGREYCEGDPNDTGDCPQECPPAKGKNKFCYICQTPSNNTATTSSGKICNPALAPTVGCAEGENVIANILAAVIKGFFIIGSIAVLIFLFLGGLTWITAGGQKQNLENAQGKITGAVIGIVIIAGTYAIMYLLGQFLGIDFFKSLVISWPTITP